jgi:hypothetical protein
MYQLAPGPVPPFAQLMAHNRQQLRLPVADRLVTDYDAAQQQDLAEVTQGEPIAQAAEHHEGDDVAPAASLGRQVQFSTSPLRSLNCRPQFRQRNRR